MYHIDPLNAIVSFFTVAGLVALIFIARTAPGIALAREEEGD